MKLCSISWKTYTAEMILTLPNLKYKCTQQIVTEALNNKGINQTWYKHHINSHQAEHFFIRDSVRNTI